jgi:dTDP-4-amino-4,6-dideoxygalactose transaminase
LIELLKGRYGALDALLTDSGTSALQLAIRGAVDGSDRPVALPAYSCYDLATAAEGAGAKVALYDLDPRTLGPELDTVTALRGFQLAGIVVAHLFGYPADVDAVRAACGDALLIEDAAQAAGGTLEGRPLGGLGSLSVLSFGRGKGMTGGGGGALLAHDARGRAALGRVRTRLVGVRPRGLREVLALSGQIVLGRPLLYGIPSSMPFLHLGETRYHPPRPPRRASLASLAVLERTMELSDIELEVRRRNASFLAPALADSPYLAGIEVLPGATPGHLRLPFLGGNGAFSRERRAAGERLGVTGMYPRTLAELPSLTPYLVQSEPDLPGARRLAERLMTAPTHSLLTESDLGGIRRLLAADT